MQEFGLTLPASLIPLILLAMVPLNGSAKDLCFTEAILELFKVINEIKAIKNERYIDSKLYTPDVTYYQNCNKSIMYCFIIELAVLSFETHDVLKSEILSRTTNKGIRSLKLEKHLRNIHRIMEDDSKDCYHCEVYKEEPAVDFLDMLLKFLQQTNDRNCKD